MAFKTVGKVSLNDTFFCFPAKLYFMAKQFVINFASIVFTMAVRSAPPNAFNVIICIKILRNGQFTNNN